MKILTYLTQAWDFISGNDIKQIEKQRYATAVEIGETLLRAEKIRESSRRTMAHSDEVARELESQLKTA